MDPADSLSDPAASAQSHCPVCRSPLLEFVVRCVKCETSHHDECFRWNQGCATFSCGGTRYDSQGAAGGVQDLPPEMDRAPVVVPASVQDLTEVPIVDLRLERAAQAGPLARWSIEILPPHADLQADGPVVPFTLRGAIALGGLFILAITTATAWILALAWTLALVWMGRLLWLTARSPHTIGGHSGHRLLLKAAQRLLVHEARTRQGLVEVPLAAYDQVREARLSIGPSPAGPGLVRIQAELVLSDSRVIQMAHHEDWAGPKPPLTGMTQSVTRLASLIGCAVGPPLYRPS